MADNLINPNSWISGKGGKYSLAPREVRDAKRKSWYIKLIQL